MSMICIAKDVYSGGNTIATHAAEELGYDCIHREVYRDAEQRYGIAAAKLEKALREAPAFFGMTLQTRKRAVAYVRAALATCLLKDELVYCGPFGPWLVPGVSHMLRVRLTAALEVRIARAAKRDGLSQRAAARRVRAADQAQQRLGEILFQIDVSDDDLVDLTIDTSELDAHTAARRIVGAVKEKRYQAMTYSKTLLKDSELEYRVRAAIADVDPEAAASLSGGAVRVRIRAPGSAKPKVHGMLQERILSLEGVDEVDIQIVDDALERGR